MSNTAYDSLYQQIHSVDPPERVERGISQADVLSPSRGFMTGFDFTLQLQVGCPGGCLFCYVPSAARLTPADVRGPQGTKWGFVLRQKERAVEKFAGHLRRGRLADRTLYWSGVTDPYTSAPEVTRALWQELSAAEPSRRPRRIAVQTRYRADRDAEGMAAYETATTPSDDGPAIVVSFSLGTDREDLIRAWERGTPSLTLRMQAIAREFNLSEAAFILKPRDPAHTAHVRLFTPADEVPFAGHPNIGAAFALANDRPIKTADLVFEEKAGLVRLRLDRIGDKVVGASLTAPQSLWARDAPGVAAVAAALSLDEPEIVTSTHPPINATVGLEFMFVEVRDVAALSKARVHLTAFDLIRASHRVESVHLYVKWPSDNGVRIQARNLSPYDGIGEDPATGSATATLTALLAQLDLRPDSDFHLEASQGIEMGRPSLLHGYAEMRRGKVAPPRISGRCVSVMQGVLTV
jgi:trans-2,3-dihydro-3-hydroxyanthranilate isomerase